MNEIQPFQKYMKKKNLQTETKRLNEFLEKRASFNFFYFRIDIKIFYREESSFT